MNPKILVLSSEQDSDVIVQIITKQIQSTVSVFTNLQLLLNALRDEDLTTVILYEKTITKKTVKNVENIRLISKKVLLICTADVHQEGELYPMIKAGVNHCLLRKYIQQLSDVIRQHTQIRKGPLRNVFDMYPNSYSSESSVRAASYA